MRFMITCVATAMLCASIAAQSPLTTTYTSNNSGASGGAVYFDLTAQTTLNITGIDVNLNSVASTPGSVDIYTCATTYVGNEANAAVWTLIGSGTVTSNGPGLPSTLALAAPFTIAQGANGYAYVGVGHSFAYTNGNGTNQTYSTNELQLDAGAAVNLAFTGTPFTPRVVNTTISYTAAGPGFATYQNVGDGCVERASASFYEYFLPSTAMDLSNSSLTMLPTGNGYVVLAGGTGFYVAPSATATNLNLADENDATITFTGTFDYPGGSTTSLDVASNGVISVASGYIGWSFTPTAFLNLSSPAWAVWHDFIPNATGNVWWEEVGGVVYITFLDVVGYSGTATGSIPSRFQLQFDTNSDSVTFAFESMDNISINTWSATSDGYVVGYTPGNGALDPGSTDLNGPNMPIVLDGADSLALQLDLSARPIQGTTVNFDTINITPGAIFGGLAFGLTNPMLDLTPFGMAGCTQYADHTAVILFFPTGATATVPFLIPNAVGVNLFAQSFVYDPSTGLTTLGAVASQGVDWLIGSF